MLAETREQVVRGALCGGVPPAPVPSTLLVYVFRRDCGVLVLLMDQKKEC